MRSEKNYKISLEELASRGQQIVAQRSGISLSKALEQVQLLKANSKVGQSSKKSRPVSEIPNISPVDIQMPEAGKEYGYFAEGRIGQEWEHLASYMDINMAKDIITKCSTDYLETKL